MLCTRDNCEPLETTSPNIWGKAHWPSKEAPTAYTVIHPLIQGLSSRRLNLFFSQSSMSTGSILETRQRILTLHWAADFCILCIHCIYNIHCSISFYIRDLGIHRFCHLWGVLEQISHRYKRNDKVKGSQKLNTDFFTTWGPDPLTPMLFKS